MAKLLANSEQHEPYAFVNVLRDRVFLLGVRELARSKVAAKKKHQIARLKMLYGKLYSLVFGAD